MTMASMLRNLRVLALAAESPVRMCSTTSTHTDSLVQRLPLSQHLLLPSPTRPSLRRQRLLRLSLRRQHLRRLPHQHLQLPPLLASPLVRATKSLHCQRFVVSPAAT